MKTLPKQPKDPILKQLLQQVQLVHPIINTKRWLNQSSLISKKGSTLWKRKSDNHGIPQWMKGSPILQNSNVHIMT